MYLEQCTDEQLKRVLEEFNATEETLQRDVKTLIEWLQKQPHLPNVKDENLLRLFLVRRKTSLESTKRTLEMYYIFKAQIFETFKNRDPSSAEFRKCYELTQAFFVPKLTPELNRVFIARIKNVPSKALPSVDEYFRTCMTFLTLTSFMSGIYNKITVVCDFKNMNALIVPLLISNFNKAFSFIFDLAPVRVEVIYYLNPSPLFEPILMIGRTLSKKLFQDRLIVWKKGEKDLIEVIPKDMLPSEYGGTAGSCDELAEQYLKEMISWKSWLDEENKYMADLSKVPEEKKKTIGLSDFGMDGSFRKLNLD